MSKQPCLYIIASDRIGTIYVGVTSDLVARLHQHRTRTGSRFASKHGVMKLVRYEFFADMPSAIRREKQLKNWHREWKLNLIEQDNPHWVDLGIALGFESVVVAATTVDAETSSA